MKLVRGRLPVKPKIEIIIPDTNLTGLMRQDNKLQKKEMMLRFVMNVILGICCGLLMYLMCKGAK